MEEQFKHLKGLIEKGQFEDAKNYIQQKKFDVNYIYNFFEMTTPTDTSTLTVDKEESLSETLLYIALNKNDLNFVNFLLSQGADPNIKRKQKTIQTETECDFMGGWYNRKQPEIDSSEVTAVEYACSLNKIDIASLLVQAGGTYDEEKIKDKKYCELLKNTKSANNPTAILTPQSSVGTFFAQKDYAEKSTEKDYAEKSTEHEKIYDAGVDLLASMMKKRKFDDNYKKLDEAIKNYEITKIQKFLETEPLLSSSLVASASKITIPPPSPATSVNSTSNVNPPLPAKNTSSLPNLSSSKVTGLQGTPAMQPPPGKKSNQPSQQPQFKKG